MKRFKFSYATMLLSLSVFVILCVTMLIMGAISYLLFELRIVSPIFGHNLFTTLLQLFILAVFIGTLLTLMFARIPMRPIQKIIEATNELAKGNFKVRLDLTQPEELKEISRSFNVMAQELENTTILRTDFVNNFSHEFKTPIISIKGFAKLLQNKELSEEQQEEYLAIIISEAERLATLSTNVLNLTNYENQAVIGAMQEFNLAEQIRKSILLLSSKWEEKDVEFDVDLEEITYCGNEEMLSQVWINLIDNAIKFSNEHAKIEVYLKTGAENIIFSITNGGESIDIYELQHIFNKFYQSDTSHKTEGNGLGLALAQRIIELHHGYIDVSSEPDKTNFKVYLPRNAN